MKNKIRRCYHSPLKCLAYIPSLSKELLKDLYSDYLAITGGVNYKNHLLFIAGLPKSGTTWLERIVEEIPGYVRLNGSILRSYKGAADLNHPHGINNRMISSTPRNRYSYLKLHTHYDPFYVEVLRNNNVKAVVLIRDIRDMLVSRYHHIINQPSHWAHQELKILPFDIGFKRSLFMVSPSDSVSILEYYTSWINGWLEYESEHPGDICILKYEDMKKDIMSVMKIFFKFYEFEFDDSDIHKIIDAQKSKQIVGGRLSENIDKFGRSSTTLRKGVPGEWVECLSEENKNIIKSVAGKVLIQSGYEVNIDW